MTIAPETVPMVSRADEVSGPPQGCWTYDDYAALPDDGQRYEIIDGVLHRMPRRDVAHQSAVAVIGARLFIHSQQTGSGRVLIGPLDVDLLLAPTVIVQPDVLVILASTSEILTPEKVAGAPNLVVEIVSPGTAGHDRRGKQDAYARAGVPEYWIADPYARTVEVLSLDGDAYRSLGVFEGGARLPSRVVPEFPVAVEQLFA